MDEEVRWQESLLYVQLIYTYAFQTLDRMRIENAKTSRMVTASHEITCPFQKVTRRSSDVNANNGGGYPSSARHCFPSIRSFCNIIWPPVLQSQVKTVSTGILVLDNMRAQGAH
jgi:hypothetical protein